MSSWYFTRRRGELFIAWLRLGVALLTTLTVAYDRQFVAPEAIRSISFGYALGAVLALVAASFVQPTVRRRVTVQCIDCIISLFFIVIAGSSTAMFLSHFVFLVAGAALRFRWRTVFLTVVLCVIAYFGARLALPAGALTLHAIINVVAVLIVGIAATLVTNYQERLREQLSTLLETRTTPLADLPLLCDSVLAVAAKAMKVEVVAAFVSGESESHSVIWSRGECRLDDSRVESIIPSIPHELEHEDFFCNAGDGEVSVVTTASGENVRAAVPLSNGVAGVLSSPLLRVKLQGTSVRGSLFFSGRDFNWDDLAFGRLIADIVAARFDDHAVVRSSSRRRVDAERQRIARDLHDGLLQSLTGAAFQIEGARRLVDPRPADAKQVLRDVQDVLAVDQNELRHLIETLRERPARAADLKSEVRFNALAAMVRRQWGAEVELNVPSLKGAAEKGTRREIHRLLREAVFNAAQHSGATRITVRGEMESDAFVLHVRNDGRGFPFRGRYDLAALDQMRQGPATLKERISALGGTLVIDSHDHGSELEIRLPLRGAGARA